MAPAAPLPNTTSLSPAATESQRPQAPQPVRTLLVLGGIGLAPPALTEALEHDGEVVVVGTTTSPVQAIELAQTLQPDVVLVDQLLGLASGTIVARHIHGDVEHTEIVLRTPWPDADRHDAERAGVFATVDVADPAAVVATTIAAAGREARRAAQSAAGPRRMS
ncbi:response regulator transcription factor [Patulibacter americanus]|uniref:response regulator transcription factor n=1 Tax=Patulibacter americanus TaxID=588672 RepID=UPI0003B4D4A6|nr:response regulator transcription factor [Patulibacter americanus]